LEMNKQITLLVLLCVLLCSCQRSEIEKSSNTESAATQISANESPLILATGEPLPGDGKGSIPKPGNNAQGNNAQEKAGLHHIILPHDEPQFPPGPGRDTFVRSCLVCHSLRYISMQPDFPEATWIKEVNKMKNTWGAHFTEAEGKEIVAYLMLVKGKKAGH
jgi:hypothetical protein